MRLQTSFLAAGRRGGRLSGLLAAGLLIWAAGLAGCAGSRGSEDWGQKEAPVAVPVPPGTTPARLAFLYSFENEKDAPYYPLEGLGGLAYSQDGGLYVCDEKGGRVHGYDPESGLWSMFDSPPSRPFRPVGIRVDGFTVLVLDMGGRLLLRYDLKGAFQDRLLNFARLDPVIQRLPTAFDVDRDGRVVVTDAAEQQVLLLDSFLTLTQTIGGPGSHREQFQDPSGVVFLPDGSFMVSDRGNRRLQHYSRQGYFEQIVGGEFDLDNPLITPQGIDCDTYGNIFVADPAASDVHVYSRALSYLFSLGSAVGLMADPELPVDVAVGPDDLLAVADRGRSAILVFRIVYD
jgi:sugar lactone lactonase YvrE